MSFSRRRLLVSCVCLVLTLGAALPAIGASPGETDVTLVSFNIHLGGVGPGGNDAIARYFFSHVLEMIGLHPSPGQLLISLDKTASLIDDLDPDVVVINEFSPWGMLAPFSKRDAETDPAKNSVAYLLSRLNRLLAARAGGRQQRWKGHFTRYSENWAGLFGNLMIYRLGRVITGEPQVHESYFRTKGKLPWKERLFFKPLDRHHVAMVLPVGGFRIVVAGTHLEDHQDQHNVVVRRKASRQMVSEMHDLRQSLGEPPTFLFGDLNALPPAYYQGGFDPEVAQWFHHDRPGPPEADPLRKNTIQIIEEEYQSTYVWKHGQLDAGAWTSPVTGPRFPLDYVYFTPECAQHRVDVLHAFVPRVAHILETISDHLPVVATVRIRPRARR
jgi:endonuclease/exonuclease/phosphatase family metal-dependent hydrolase